MEEFDDHKLLALAPPPKLSLFAVNKRPALIERRRRELEAWLWNLVGHPQVARSSLLDRFLELSDTARTVTRSGHCLAFSACNSFRASIKP